MSFDILIGFPILPPMARDPDLDASASWPHHISTKNYPYSPSLASTASSSSSSVFSLDAPSSQSSVSSSVGWSSSAWNSENEYENQYFVSRQSTTSSSDEEEVITTSNLPPRPRPKLCAEAVAPESRQHPRRTQRLNSYECQDGKSLLSCPRPPPSLVRQSERKENFVDSLVGKLTLDNLGNAYADETTASKTPQPRCLRPYGPYPSYPAAAIQSLAANSRI